MAVSEQPYKRPPITEAVIEIRYAEQVEFGSFERGLSDVKRHYSSDQPWVNYNVTVEVPPANEAPASLTHVSPATFGRRLASTDETERVLLLPLSFVVAQLAPYPGWDRFFARFQRDWGTWKRAVGYRKIVRVAVRYINRLDIPREGRIIEEASYLNAYAKLPEFGPTETYGVQARFPTDDKGYTLFINTALVPSPLLDSGSILLDLDVAKDRDPPQNDEGISDTLAELRMRKNAVFEACITEKARELFRQ
jgi:uncharacterized protein (TIGR04255 family)